MTHNVKVMAIDGPSGSGKSTIAKKIAKDLGLVYIDTGAMFRAIAYILKDLDVDFENTELLPQTETKIAKKLKEITFKYAPTQNVLIEVDGIDLTQKIREHDISKLASLTSRYPVVRDYLKKIQREIAVKRPSLLDGRDIGTVIFPDAPLKFFITASSRVRAQRRYEQLLGFDEKNRELYDLEQIEEDIKERDYQDMNRIVAPLKQAEDAILIDTSNLSIAEVLTIIETEFAKKKHFFYEDKK